MARSKAEKSNYGYFKVYYKGKQFYGKTLAEANAKRDAFMQKEQAGIDVLTHEKSIFRNYAMHWIEVYRSDCGKTQHRQYITMDGSCGREDGSSFVKGKLRRFLRNWTVKSFRLSQTTSSKEIYFRKSSPEE